MGAYNIVNPAHLVAGQLEDVGDILANLQAIQTILNGGIDNSNINAAAAILASKLAGYPTDGTKYLAGDGNWKTAGGAAAITNVNISAANTDLAAPAGGVNYWAITTATGTLRSIGAPAVAGTVINLFNATANFVQLKHQLAGGTGAKLLIINAGDRLIAPGQTVQLAYDGTNWQEINRPAVELIFDSVAGGASPAFDSDTITGFANSIPQVYKSLRFEAMLRVTGAVGTTNSIITFNNDSGANYDIQVTYFAHSATAYGGSHNPSTTGWAVDAGTTPGASNGDANVFSNVVGTIQGYTTALHKPLLSQYWGGDPTTTVYNILTGGRWKSTSAMTRIALTAGSGNWVSGSRWAIYGEM